MNRLIGLLLVAVIVMAWLNVVALAVNGYPLMAVALSFAAACFVTSIIVLGMAKS